ncbi:DUF6541 family protein [Actinokineospora xionganensis]|uniref:Uncharacterized protein n=1 Tax=Actinokineospora xionganensis TaxID=2684470 RepID=A0ABR7L2D0_9PSEU|nr:DUF6541 family protein [Actinokineospora xionganensis]MBC6446851.1 hypothetical protein [Actinokineospora xionganensis]
MLTNAGLLCLVLTTLLVVPGLLVGVSAGLRGWVLLGTAPVLTYGVVSLGAPLAPALLGGWSVWALLAVTAAVCVVVFGARLAGRRWFPMSPGDGLPRWSLIHHAGVVAALVIAAGVGLLVTSRSTAGFTAVHQFWDAIFHANSVRFIAETGESAPSALRAINDPSNQNFFYPNSFHVLVATALQVTAGTVPQLLNLQSGLLAFVFALSMIGVLRAAKARPALIAATALLAGTFTSFPYALEFFGPVWPFAVGVAVIPGFVALFVTLLDRRDPALVLITALAATGLVTLHPSVALSAAVFCGVYVLQRWITARRVPLPELAAVGIMGVLAAARALPELLKAASMATASGFDWPTYGTPGAVLGMILFQNYETALPQWWLVVALIAGVVGLRRLRDLGWWLVGGLVFIVLFVLAASYEGPTVALLTGPWWNDRWRFAALCTLPLLLVAANGFVVARDFLVRVTARWTTRDDVIVRSLAFAAVVVAFAGVSNTFYIDRNVTFIQPSYGAQAGTMTPPKAAAIEELGNVVPDNGVVMNDPTDGSAWMWALEDVQPVFGHVFSGRPDLKSAGADRVELWERFDELDTDTEIQAIVRKLGITHVFFTDDRVYGAKGAAPGLDDLAEARSLKLVFAKGSSRVYEVALDQPRPQQRPGG